MAQLQGQQQLGMTTTAEQQQLLRMLRQECSSYDWQQLQGQQLRLEAVAVDSNYSSSSKGQRQQGGQSEEAKNAIQQLQLASSEVAHGSLFRLL